MDDRRLIPLDDVQEERIGYLWANRIPFGAITVIDGDPGCGKSTVTYDLAARTTTGRAMPNCEGAISAAGVVLLQAEDNLGATVLKNLKAAGADISRIRAFDKRRFVDSPLVLHEDISLIERAIGEVHAKLVVIDPLTAFLGGNANSDQSVRKSLGPLAAMAEQTGVAVVVVRHLRKSGGRNSVHSGAGSIGIIAAARSALIVGDDPDSEEKHRHVIAVSKSNLADTTSLSYKTIRHPDGAITVEWLGPSQRTADDLAAAKAARDERTMLFEAKYVLYSILETGPVSAKEVSSKANAAGVSRRTLMRAKQELGIRSRKHGSGRGSHWLWQPPESEELIRQFKDRALEDYIDEQVYGDDDPPLPGDEWKSGGGTLNWSDDDENEDNGGLPC